MPVQAPTPEAAQWKWDAPTESHLWSLYKRDSARRRADDTDVGVNADVTYGTGGSEIGNAHAGHFVLKYRADPNQDRNVSIPKNVKKGRKKKKNKLGNYESFLLLLNGNVVLNIFLSDILSSECSSYQAQFEPHWWVSQTATALSSTNNPTLMRVEVMRYASQIAALRIQQP